MKVIKITVSREGEIKVETKGFAGAECQQASRLIEAALGQRISTRLTGEYYQSSANTQSNATGAVSDPPSSGNGQ